MSSAFIVFKTPILKTTIFDSVAMYEILRLWAEAGVTFVNETNGTRVTKPFITFSKQDKSLRQNKCDHTQIIKCNG